MTPLLSQTRLLLWLAACAASLTLACKSGDVAPGDEGTGGSGTTGTGGSGTGTTGAGNSGGSGTTTGAGGGTAAGSGGTGTTTGAGGTGTTTGAAGSSGTGAGGTTGTGAGGSGPPPANQVRTVTPFDDGWLFSRGDPAGAQQTAFVDTAWRALSVPHDWSIEGPFDPASPVLGDGGYVPAGVGWYRKHFTLPAGMIGQRVFVEFDGVMANSEVFINGTSVGRRPFGYVSFRYEITGQAVFGAAGNVLAVRADNSAQPASRWYAGAGIYRHVRLIATNPVHVGTWATFVTTPTATATAATVHVQTSVTNQGTATASVIVQAVVIDPTGARLAPVSSAAQNILTAGSADFAVDVPVANPRLWSTTAPSMYQLAVNVQVGGATVDDDVVPFGIRTIRFDPDQGFFLNGTSLKLKGVGMHHDVSGLGAAVPMRAWQRRLAQVKAVGANAVRTAHNPYAPEFLDLCDRMGLLVLDEFFDAWINFKRTADYSTAFRTWGIIDLGDTVRRDRNHPSVVLYSIGNEIRDALASRMTTATNLIGVIRPLDSTRPITQALFRPMENLDYPGGMVNILDVFGANYRIAEVIAAQSLVPHHAGVVTEIGLTTGDWTTVLNTPALTGEFLWTSHDYLGEVLAPVTYPTVGASTGMMDRMGTPKAAAYSFSGIWGGRLVRPPTGTNATRLVLTADHPTLVTDPNDVSYIKATVADAAGAVVTTASNPITFAVTGPGTIIAVDSGSVMAEPFRGNVRNAFQGLAFAIIRATGTGPITVTASAANLTASSVTVQSSAGAFIPCAGTCD